jgi:drug/metabolite transporter (DMT)-like permease
MNICYFCLFFAAIFWSISPILYTKAGKFYGTEDYNSSFFYIFCGICVSTLGTILFSYASNICNSLSQAVIFTYILPVIFTTIISIIIYNEKIHIKKIGGIFVILVGLFLTI